MLSICSNITFIDERIELHISMGIGINSLKALGNYYGLGNKRSITLQETGD